MLGTIVSASDRGLWFAEPDSTDQTVFIHQRHVKGSRRLHVNERIKFGLAPSTVKLGEVEAINVELTDVVVARQTSGKAVRP